MVKLKVATGLEILTILLPGHFLVMGSLANSLKVRTPVCAPVPWLQCMCRRA
jgi:hypothetical protein